MEQSDTITNVDFIARVQDSLSRTSSDAVRMSCLEQLAAMPKMPRSHILVSLLLRTLREDPNAVVRHEAAFVLGRVHDLHSDLVGDEVFLALCKSARIDSSIIVRHEATEVLGNLADPRVIGVLHELAEDDNVDVALTATLGLERQALDRGGSNWEPLNQILSEAFPKI